MIYTRFSPGSSSHFYQETIPILIAFVTTFFQETKPWNPGDVMGKERTDADEEVGDNYRPTLTKSELKFFERQRKREMDRILLKV